MDALPDGNSCGHVETYSWVTFVYAITEEVCILPVKVPLVQQPQKRFEIKKNSVAKASYIHMNSRFRAIYFRIRSPTS